MALRSPWVQQHYPTASTRSPPDLVDWLASEMLTHEVKPEIEAFDLSHIFQAAKNGRGTGGLPGRSTCNSSWA